MTAAQFNPPPEGEPTVSVKREVWGYASDHEEEEWFGVCASREEAIAEAAEALVLSPGDPFYVCAGAYEDAADHVPDFQTVMDCMHESLMGVACIPGNGFDAADGAAERLAALLQTWARTNLTARKWVLSGSPEQVVFNPPTDGGSNGAGKTEEVG